MKHTQSRSVSVVVYLAVDSEWVQGSYGCVLVTHYNMVLQGCSNICRKGSRSYSVPAVYKAQEVNGILW